jgi:hypothetical protein
MNVLLVFGHCCLPTQALSAQNPAIGNPVPFRLPDRGATIADAIDRGALAEQSPGTPFP